MKSYFLVLFILLLTSSCKGTKPNNKIIFDKSNSNTSFNNLTLDSIKVIKKKHLQTAINFNNLLSNIKNVKNVGKKNKDWMFDRARTLDSVFLLNNRKFVIKTISYEYKNNLKFYVHNLKHIKNDISIKPFLENAFGKTTRGYTQNRVLIFAMKNDKEANFIDIPEKMNPLKLRKELLEILYKNIDSDVIECNRTKKCKYKDLRKTKSE